MAEITLKNLIKSYGNVEVLHHIDAQINDGEFVVIVGPSGCGKSTLLRMIAGLETVTSGDVHIQGKRVNDLEPAERDIAMVFQNYALYPHMNVRENMAYGLKIRKLSPDEINARVEKAAEILEIKEFLDRKPKQLSGGQRQRVAMGRAIVREPAVFLFDEPLSNLDAKLRVQMRLEIRKLQKRLGVTSIFVTHDQVEAMTLGDRLMVLNGGYTEQFGTPIELYKKPASMFVAGFIGSPSMNFIPVQKTTQKSITLNNGTVLDITHKCPKEKIVFGIRPEHLIPHKSGKIALRVSMTEHLGDNTLVHGTLEGSDLPLIANLKGIVEVDFDTILKFNISSDDIHFFNETTGKRID